MSFTVSLERSLEVDRHEAFSRFIDFRTWKSWMPASFRPIRGPERALRKGDRLTVSLDIGLGIGLPSVVLVSRVDPDREITWRGGVKGLLLGEHSFFFEDKEGGGTILRSYEEFTGLVMSRPAIAARGKKLAERIGAEQADGFLSSY
jgi:hypothetical protein